MYILLAVLIVAVLWFVLKPKWAPKPPDTAAWSGKASQASKQVSVKASAASKQASAKAGQMYQGLRGRLRFRSHTHDLAQQFKQWVAEAAPGSRAELYNTLPASADGFAAWLNGLSQKELEQFTKKVARFCESLNFNLAWLTDAQVGREPELKRAVEDTILLYSLTTWRADSVQQDVKGFLAYQAWQARPNRHKAFGQQLLGHLIHNGVVTVSPDQYLASEKERKAHATAAIRKVADENRDALRVALRQVVAGAPAAPAPAPPAPAMTLAPQGAAA